jgi:hypothetical protein
MMTDASGPTVVCNCNLPAKKLAVKKEGPNQGKEFFACPQNQDQSCKFFQWATDVVAANNNKKRKVVVETEHKSPQHNEHNNNNGNNDRLVALNLLADRLSALEQSAQDDGDKLVAALQSIKEVLEKLVKQHK